LSNRELSQKKGQTMSLDTEAWGKKKERGGEKNFLNSQPEPTMALW